MGARYARPRAADDRVPGSRRERGCGLAAGRERGTPDAVAKPDRRRRGEARTHRCRIERSGLGAIQHRDGVTVVAGRCAGRSFRVGPVSIEHVRECFRLVRPRNPVDGPAADRSLVRDATARRIRPRCGGASAGVGSNDDDRATADLRPGRPRRRLAADPGAPRATRGWPASSARRASPTSRRSRPARSTIRPGSGRAAVDDLGARLATPTGRSTMDISRGPEWATWWSGGAFNHAIAATEPRAARDPDGGAVAWEGEDGEVRRLTNARAARRRSNAAARMFAAQGVRRRRPGRDLPADAARDGDRDAGARPARGDLHADLLGLRRAGRRDPARATARRASSSPPTGSSAAAAGPDEAGRRRGGRACRRRCSGSSSCRRLGDRRGDAVEPRARPLVGRGDRARSSRSDAGADAAPRRDRPRDAVHADLHLGHDRPAEGRRPRPRRLPDQGRRGPRPHVRPAPRRRPVLVHRPRLDDGPVGDRGVAAARRAARPVRGRAGLPGPGPDLVDRRPPRRHPPRRCPRRSSGR